MKVVRTFHPVGQGAFYSERFHENKERNDIGFVFERSENMKQSVVLLPHE